MASDKISLGSISVKAETRSRAGTDLPEQARRADLKLDRLLDQVREKLPPALELALSGLDPEETIKIDRLHLELGPVRLEEVGARLAASLAEALRRQDSPTLSGSPGPVKYYIDNAGLVLTAPFLPALFKRLNLLDEGGAFPDDHKRGLAVALSGRIDGEQWRRPSSPLVTPWVLNELLCGRPPSDEAPADPRPEDALAAAEIKNMLAAMVSHWPGLGSLGPDQLVINFIRRPGVLRLEPSPRLLVERRPHDVLLATLPWALSIIMTPWMTRPLEVIWNE